MAEPFGFVGSIVGHFHSPGTSLAKEEKQLDLIRRRLLPVFGSADRICSHL